MISHRAIMANVAQAVAADAGVLEYCIEHFGRGLACHVGAYAQGVPGAEDSPFLWITPEGENEDQHQDETFTVRMVVGGCVTGPEGQKVITNVVTPRTEMQNGVTVNGGNAVVEDLRDMILAIVRETKAGARVSAIRRTENDIAHFPLEWAEVHVDYFEPEEL